MKRIRQPMLQFKLLLNVRGTSFQTLPQPQILKYATESLVGEKCHRIHRIGICI